MTSGIKRIFSFDCAVKNFGYCIADCMHPSEVLKIIQAAARLLREHIGNTKKQTLLKDITTINSAIDNVLVIKAVNRINVGLDLEGKTKPDPYAIKMFLESLHTFGIPDLVLIERQMTVNFNAFAVLNYIEYHFAGSARIQIVNPADKNMITLDKNNGDYEKFVIGHTLYTANKKHSEHNFIYFLTKIASAESKKNINGEDMRHCDIVARLKNTKVNDMSDAFMMVLVAFLRNFYIARC